MQQPIQDRIVVRPDEAATMFGSLHIPDMADQDIDRGTVIMIGPGKDGIECGVEVGDYVIYSKFAGTQHRCFSFKVELDKFVNGNLVRCGPIRYPPLYPLTVGHLS